MNGPRLRDEDYATVCFFSEQASSQYKSGTCCYLNAHENQSNVDSLRFSELGPEAPPFSSGIYNTV